MTEIKNELLWIRGLFEKQKQERFINCPMIINADNQGAISFSKNYTVSEFTKTLITVNIF